MKKPARPARWAVQTVMLGILAAAAIVVVQGLDERWTQWISDHRWPQAVKFMVRSLFEGEGFGGGDPVVLFLLAAVIGYYIAWKRPGSRMGPLRAQLGFVLSSAIVWALGLVHALKWSIGRARPYQVLYGEDPFTAWYEFGPHFVSEGVYHGSFPSGHTAQAALLLTLAYLLAGAFGDRPWGRSAAWSWGALGLCLTAAMGMAQVMSLSHWLTDVIAGLFLTWIGIHLTYHLVLRVPDQTAFFRRADRWPQAPEGWELRLSAWLVVLLAGAAAAVLGIRALFRPQEPVFVPLLPLGAAVFFVSLYMARGARRRALQELDGPGE